LREVLLDRALETIDKTVRAPLLKRDASSELEQLEIIDTRQRDPVQVVERIRIIAYFIKILKEQEFFKISGQSSMGALTDLPYRRTFQNPSQAPSFVVFRVECNIFEGCNINQPDGVAASSEQLNDTDPSLATQVDSLNVDSDRNRR
jgi:hypothetical protein